MFRNVLLRFSWLINRIGRNRKIEKLIINLRMDLYKFLNRIKVLIHLSRVLIIVIQLLKLIE